MALHCHPHSGTATRNCTSAIWRICVCFSIRTWLPLFFTSPLLSLYSSPSASLPTPNENCVSIFPDILLLINGTTAEALAPLEYLDLSYSGSFLDSVLDASSRVRSCWHSVCMCVVASMIAANSIHTHSSFNILTQVWSSNVCFSFYSFLIHLENLTFFVCFFFLF